MYQVQGHSKTCPWDTISDKMTLRAEVVEDLFEFDVKS